MIHSYRPDRQYYLSKRETESMREKKEITVRVGVMRDES